MNYYVRATGVNQLTGGTSKWLKIRNVEKIETKAYKLEVRIRGTQRFVFIYEDIPPKNLEFAQGWPGLMPVSYRRIIE